MQDSKTGEPRHGEASARLAVFGWLVGAIFFFYAWILRVAPSVMVQELMQEFATGAAAIGNLSATYFYTYAGFQIPIGLMMDRFGPRRLLTIAAMACGIGCLLFAMSPAYIGAFWARLLIGGAAAFSLVGAMAVAGQWFAPHRFAILSGLAMLIGLSGGVVGQAPLRLSVEAIGWRSTMTMLAAGGVLIGLMAWMLVRDRTVTRTSRTSVLTDLALVSRNRQTWIIALAGLGTAGPLLGFAGLWGVPYMVAVHGQDQATAAAITSVTFVGFAVGAPIFGWLSDRLGRRRIPMTVGLATCAGCMAALVLIPNLAPLTLTALCLACGLGGGAQVLGFALVKEHNALAVSGAAIGFVNCAFTGGGAIYQPLLGWLLDMSWDGRVVAGARVYSAAAYQTAFLVLLAAATIGAMCALLTRETYCRQVQVQT